MEATRVRFESLVEWAVAAAFILAVAGGGAVAVRELRTVNAVTPVIAREVVREPTAAAGMPSRAVSVPMLLLADGKAVRIGDTLESIAQRLGRQAEVGTQAVDHTANGQRLTRAYEYAHTHFVLIFEPFERGAAPRVAAIYLP